jgi:hypothetical protein
MAKRMALTQVGGARQVVRAARIRHLSEFEKDLARFQNDGDIRALSQARKMAYRVGGQGVDDLTQRIKVRMAALGGKSVHTV